MSHSHHGSSHALLEETLEYYSAPSPAMIPDITAGDAMPPHPLSILTERQWEQIQSLRERIEHWVQGDLWQEQQQQQGAVESSPPSQHIPDSNSNSSKRKHKKKDRKDKKKKKKEEEEEESLEEVEEEEEEQQSRRLFLEHIRSTVVDDMFLFRYLKGLSWVESDALEFVQKTLRWRLETRPEQLRLNASEILQEVARTGLVYHYGYDRECRPVLWLDASKDTFPNDDTGKMVKFQLLVWLHELCIRKMVDGVYGITWVVELKDASLSLGFAKAVKGLFDELGQYNAERLGRAIVLNPGWGVNIIWKFVAAFLTKEQRDKYVFIRGDHEKVAAELARYVAPSQQVRSFGYHGQSDYVFDVDRELQKERLYYEQIAATRIANCNVDEATTPKSDDLPMSTGSSGGATDRIEQATSDMSLACEK